MSTQKQRIKEEKISHEIKRLKKIFEELDENKLILAKNLIENASFMAVSLSDIQTIINRKGYSEKYQNGEHQKGVKKTTEIEIYNTTIKNYNQTMKQLYDMLPTPIKQFVEKEEDSEEVDWKDMIGRR